MLLVFDIGGTKCRLGLSDDGQSFTVTEIFSTPSEFEDGMELFRNFLKKHDAKVSGIVGGIAGPLNSEKTMQINAPNMPGWVNKPLKATLCTIIQSENVFLENDAALAGVGEVQFGEGKKFSIVAYITLGTGVGGVRIVDGKIDKNAYGFEPGHQIISITNQVSHSLEFYLGGASIKKTTGKSAEETTDPAFWDEKTFYLAIGLANVSVLWSPECIILGGSLTQKISFDNLLNHYKNVLQIFPQKPKVVLGSLGDLAGLYGALGMGAKFLE